MSLWLLTVALGNAFVAVFAEFSTFNLAIEFFFYAGLMVAFTLLFVILTWNYQYIDEEEPSSSSKITADTTQDSVTLLVDETTVGKSDQQSLLLSKKGQHHVYSPRGDNGN